MEQIADLLGLWSNRNRASREVKALAHSHLDAMEQKMREMAEMQAALTILVASCHGDDEPHCAILQELAVSSPQAPEPGAVGGKQIRKSSGGSRVARETARTDSTSHLDLMAWTHGARRAGHPLSATAPSAAR